MRSSALDAVLGWEIPPSELQLTSHSSYATLSAMSEDQNRTSFRIELPGLEVSISGDRAFVEDIFQEISADLLPALTGQGRVHAGLTPLDLPVVDESSYTWVYGCSPLYSKVYAVRDTHIRAGLLGGAIDSAQLRRIYVDGVESELFAAIAGGQQTLWAEFTDEGKERFQTPE